MKPEFKNVAGPALHETHDKFKLYCPDADWGAVSFALGLFRGIVMRRLKGEPDPVEERLATLSNPAAPAGPQTLALNWECTKCDWTHAPDLELYWSLSTTVYMARHRHFMHSPGCRGELHFWSQFIAAKES